MILKFLSFLKKPTSKDILINTFGNYLNVFFVAFFALVMLRVLPPSQYGVFSVLFGIAYVLANILDFGTTATIYSYLPTLIEAKADNLYRFIKSTFYYQSVFSLVAIAILFLSFPFLDKVFFKTNAPIWELYLTAISVLFFIWQNFTLNILFAAKKFLKANFYLNLANVFKTLILFFLVSKKLVTVGSIIFTFGIVGPVIFFVFLFLEKKDLIFVLLKSEVKREEFKFGYTLTYFIASQFLNLGMRMDLFLLSYFRAKDEVGFYGASQKVILTILTTIISITQVLSPAFSKVKTKVEIKNAFKHGLMYMFLPIGLFLFAVFLPDFIYLLYFTKEYAKAIPITKALSLAFIIFPLINIPLLFILYTVKKPIYVLIANVLFFTIMSLGSYISIPKMGVFGPPYVIFVAFLISGTILLAATIREYKKLQT